MRVRFSLLLLALCSFVVAQSNQLGNPIKHFPEPDRIRYDGACLTIEGEDMFMYSAAFHYFRCPEDLRRDRFQKIKEAGFNTVETYVPWNWHEREMPANVNDNSKFDFSDLQRWLTMAQDEFDLYTIIRPGPFICAEFLGGGYPRWLAKFRPNDVKGFWLRSGNDEEHIAWSKHWFDAVCKEFADEQITRKPKGEKGIIMIQIENEYNHHGTLGKETILKALYNSVVSNGWNVPIFSCLTNECRSSSDAELSQVFDSDNYYVGLNDAPSCAHRMANLKREQPDAPGLVTELQGGWFSLVTRSLSESHYSDYRHFKAVGLMSILGGSTGLNYYMYFGGTHFAGWGARGMTTSYDYNSAIRESGAVGPKYYASKEIGEFISKFESQLTRTEGGPCELQNAPESLFGGVRVAADGTKFVFLHNTDDKKTIEGKVTLVPGKMSRPSEPIFNINQHGEKVLIETSEADDDNTFTIEPFEASYKLEGLDSKVLVIPAGKSPKQGDWWPKAHKEVKRPAVPAPVRIATATYKEDEHQKADWKSIPELVSLSDLNINDFRYSLYRSNVTLNKQQAKDEKFLLFNMFTRDIVSVTINGKPAKRLFPHDADAQSWTTRDCFVQIRPDEYDNRFDVSGLLREGNNEIVVSYENLGHAHGYFPMEELAGIRKGGLSLTETALTHPLEWEFARDAAGITQGWEQPNFNASNWKAIELDTATKIERVGNGIQPKADNDGLFTWYRVEFNLPKQQKGVWIPWLARINASGNGYMWLNGENIGRHWEAGPQRDFYLPECWLKFGEEKNVLVFGLRQTENGALLNAIEVLPYPDAAEYRK